jgi:hypothetical protein
MFVQDGSSFWPTGCYHFGKVLPGAKGFACTGNVHTPHFFAGLALVKCLLHEQGHLAVKGVIALGAVKGYGSNSIFDVE